MDNLLAAGKNNSRPHFWSTFNLPGDVIEVIAIKYNICDILHNMPMLAVSSIWKHKKPLRLQQLPCRENSGQARIE
jgi:hypothetical protein